MMSSITFSGLPFVPSFEVTRDGNHKDREASYDINADVDYTLYDESKKLLLPCIAWKINSRR